MESDVRRLEQGAGRVEHLDQIFIDLHYHFACSFQGQGWFPEWTAAMATRTTMKQLRKSYIRLAKFYIADMNFSFFTLSNHWPRSLVPLIPMPSGFSLLFFTAQVLYGQLSSLPDWGSVREVYRKVLPHIHSERTNRLEQVRSKKVYCSICNVALASEAHFCTW